MPAARRGFRLLISDIPLVAKVGALMDTDKLPIEVNAIPDEPAKLGRPKPGEERGKYERTPRLIDRPLVHLGDHSPDFIFLGISTFFLSREFTFTLTPVATF